MKKNLIVFVFSALISTSGFQEASFAMTPEDAPEKTTFVSQVAPVTLDVIPEAAEPLTQGVQVASNEGNNDLVAKIFDKVPDELAPAFFNALPALLNFDSLFYDERSEYMQ